MAQALQLSFQTDTDKARNAIAQLASTVSANMLTIGTAMKGAYEHQDKLISGIQRIPSIAGAALTSLVAIGAAYLAFKYVSDSIDEVIRHLKEMVDIANKAQGAGVGTSFFQAWTKQAQDLGTETQTLVGILNKAREAATVNLGHQGEAVSTSAAQDLLAGHVTAGNISKADVDAFNTATSLEEKYKVLLNLLDKLKSEGKDLARFDIAKGILGPDFEAMLRNGVDAVGKMRNALTGIEKVQWPPDIVAKAKEINDELEKADKTMREAWWPIQQDIERSNQNIAKGWADIRLAIANAAEYALSFYEKIKGIGDEVDRIKKSDWFQYFTAVGNLVSSVRTVPGLIGDLTAGRPVGTSIAQPMAGGLVKQNLITAVQGTEKYGPEYKDTSKSTDNRISQTKEAKSALDTYLDSLQKSIATLNAEAETYGKSNTVKARAVDLAKAEDAARRDAEEGKRKSAQLTDEERQKVEAWADAEGKAKDRTEQLTRAQAAANEQAQLLGNTLISALDKIGQSGTKASDVIKDMVKNLIKAVEQALILGSGPFANLFGTQGQQGNPGGLAGLAIGGAGRFFGGFGFGGGYGASDYASAAAAAAPGSYGPGFAGGGMVGRDGRPMFIPHAALAAAKHFDSGGGVAAIVHPGEVILNAAQQRNVAGSMMGGAKINLTHAPVINGTGLSAEQVFSVIQRSQNDFARRIGPIVSDWQRRHAKI